MSTCLSSNRAHHKSYIGFEISCAHIPSYTRRILLVQQAAAADTPLHSTLIIIIITQRFCFVAHTTHVHKLYVVHYDSNIYVRNQKVQTYLSFLLLFFTEQSSIFFPKVSLFYQDDMCENKCCENFFNIKTYNTHIVCEQKVLRVLQ